MMWQQVDRADVSRCSFDTPDYSFHTLGYMQMYENHIILHYTYLSRNCHLNVTRSTSRAASHGFLAFFWWDTKQKDLIKSQ